MIVFLCTLWLIFLYYLGYNKFGQNDTFSPLKLITIKMVIMDIPYLLYLSFYPDTMFPEILRVCNTNLDNAILNYALVKTLAYVFIIIGIRISSSFIGLGRVKVFSKNLSSKVALSFSIIFFFLGAYYYYLFTTSAGGILYLINNLNTRVEILNDLEGASEVVSYLTLSIILLVYHYSFRRSKLKFIIILLYVILAITVFSTFGGRKSVLYLLILIFGVVNYYILSIKIKNIKKSYIVFGTIALSFYILIMPILRANEGFDKINRGEVDLIEVLNIEDLVVSLSYVYIDVLAVNYFDLDNVWGFKSTNDIFINFSGRNKSKELLPPIDDGVYFRTIADRGSYIVPPVPRGQMYASSWPIENLGFAYANFWIFGVMIFFILIGIFYNYFYALFLANTSHPLFMYLYVFVVFNFNFSNLRIVQFLYFLPMIIFLAILFKYLEKRNG